MPTNIYKENGFSSRDDYLDNLAAEYGIDPETVFVLADTLGPNEDFDGLVTHLEDINMGGMDF